MSFDTKALLDLLPAIYRIRDAEQGGPLSALLSILAEQMNVLEEDLEQLYDDQFIETCAEWVVPYIGDLIGCRQLHGVTSQVRSPRAEVANTIRFRRRKGTAAMLEQLARDVTGWDARAVEFFQRLSTTQYMNRLRPDHPSTPDLRQWEPLERLGTPFDALAHVVDVRRAASGRGRYNIPNVGIFLWRLRSHSLTGSPAFKVDDHRYRFSPLGNDAPLFNQPEAEEEITHLAAPVNVPIPIGRRMLDAYKQLYYGADKSFSLQGIGIEEILACDLSDADPGGTFWAHTPSPGKVAIDPVLGRISFGDPPASPPLVTFHYVFGADLGGGEYDREDSLDLQLVPVEGVPVPHGKIQDALDALHGNGAVEIGDSGRYAETPQLAAAKGGRIELRSANTARPALLLGGDLTISGDDDSEVTLNGLVIADGALHVTGRLRRLRLIHCTLVPGVGLSVNATPVKPGAPSLVVESNTIVEIDHCILGGVRAAEGAQVQITSSILDATGESQVAYAAIDGDSAAAPLHVENSTVIGKVHALSIELASNTIFLARLAAGDGWTAPVVSDRRQEGCIRFSYLPPDSRVPRRYRCQPSPQADEASVRPMFTSLRYGDPGYGQLTRRCAAVILQGADDQSEMGAFHDLFQPQRETNLRVRLDEYLRFGLEAGFFYGS